MSSDNGAQRHDLYDEPLRKQAMIGEPVTWVPTAFWKASFPGAALALHGRVTYVNTAHRFFVVEADCNGTPLREAFKF